MTQGDDTRSAGAEPGIAIPDGPSDGASDDGEVLSAGERRCIVTRERRPRRRLIRFVLDMDGQVIPDVDEKLPGRGLWLSPGRDMVEMAASRRAFARAARRPVTVPPDLADRVEGLLVRRCLNLLGLARRGGQVVTGFEKVRARLREGSVGVLLAASDGAADGRAKVVALAAALARDHASEPERNGPDREDPDHKDWCRKDWERPPGARQTVLVTAFTAAELGQPLGRDRAVHVALDSGRLATRLLDSCTLLTGFRADPVMGPVSMARVVISGDAEAVANHQALVEGRMRGLTQREDAMG